NALDRFQALDARLLGWIEQERAALPPLAEQIAPGKLAGMRKPVMLVAVIVLAVVIVGAGGYAIAARRGHTTESVAVGQRLSGWVVTADVSGNLIALNLTSGQQRPFDSGRQPTRPGYFPSSTALSPNGTLIANQVASAGQMQYQELVIETTNAKEVNRIRLTDSSLRFAGWLGNSTVLEISYPPQESGESADDYFTRAQTHALLTGVDITTGAEAKLFTGAITEVFPSPDGTMIAIVSTSVQSNSGLRTVDLRRVEAGRVGDAITSVTDRVAPDSIVSLSGLTSSVLVWTPDSSRVFMTTIDAPVAAATPTPDTVASPIPAPPASTRIVAIARDGKIQTLPEPTDAAANVPITISPDGARLIVQSMALNGNAYRYRISELALSSDTYRPLTDWSPASISSPVWSPDGTSLLGFERQPFLLTPTQAQYQLEISVIRLIAVLTDGKSDVAMTRMPDEIGTNFFAWLPEDTFPASQTVTLPVRLNQPQPVALSQANLRIDDSFQASTNDDYVILHDPTDQWPVIWDRTTNEGRKLPQGTHDLTWFPHSAALIGVGTSDSGQTTAPSRLVTYAPAFDTFMPSFDYRPYDPAKLGSSLVKQYATPLMSPDENTLAFFVLDARDHSVALWLATYDGVPKPVAHWALPNDNKLSYVPIAGWIDNQTLLFAEPGDWHGGLPGEAQLNRLTVQTDGSAAIDTAATLKPHGTERGIAIDELAINQASGHIAYRLRHFTKNSTNDGIVDTISIASVEKLSDALEISRGGSSSGLSWSPDGRLLAATTPDAIEFYSASGDALLGVSNLDFPNEPRWVDQNTVWFNESNDQGSKIMSVQLQ
ncbi:MAG TPA: hypothetical protein VF201_09675, partial [Nitrolancea sp.]